MLVIAHILFKRFLPGGLFCLCFADVFLRSPTAAERSWELPLFPVKPVPSLYSSLHGALPPHRGGTRSRRCCRARTVLGQLAL